MTGNEACICGCALDEHQSIIESDGVTRPCDSCDCPDFVYAGARSLRPYDPEVP